MIIHGQAQAMDVLARQLTHKKLDHFVNEKVFVLKNVKIFLENATYFSEEGSANFSKFVFLGIPESSLSTENSNCQFFSIGKSFENATCQTYVDQIENNSSNVELKECDSDGVVFDVSVVRNSIVTQFGLACKRAPIKNAVGSAYMVILKRPKIFLFTYPITVKIRKT